MKNDFEFMLFDRIEKIKQINDKYDLEKNAYISFSGGKDSTVLHHLVDLALPNNKIPRVFINTGIEYVDIVKFVKELASNDDRFVIINPTKNIKDILNKYGYPFKSKEHSQRVYEFQKGNISDYIKYYIREDSKKKNGYKCPKILMYQFSNNFKINISDKCCLKLKKEPADKWCKVNNKRILLTGMRKDEGGRRKNINCIVLKNNKLKKFHPLLVVNDEWENKFIEKYNIELCKLYYPPYNFERTGCKGCPFALDLEKVLETMKKLLPNEYKQCEILWKPVYDEYRRINYRLKKYKQMTIFDCLEEGNKE